jgi:hypothetical protein
MRISGEHRLSYLRWLFYAMFALVEIGLMLTIVWYSWRWPGQRRRKPAAPPSALTTNVCALRDMSSGCSVVVGAWSGP